MAALSWRPLAATAYTVVLASLVGYGIFNTLLSRNPSSAVVPWALLAPVVAMVGAWAVHGDAPNLAESTGGAMLLAGVLVATRPSKRMRKGLGLPS
ncbi:EamA family transporter [Nocardioides palaemonis]|uniref:EamA family transporter n=1 Tax=Nocardioides palaemonis TaxID=2829810 RepID=UPI0027DB6147|nr:EamA family transporter [Nocardioides palaemonis]